MNEIKIFNQLQEIKSASGANAKKEYLRTHALDQDLITFMQAVLDDDISYNMGINSLEAFKAEPEEISFREFLAGMQELSRQKALNASDKLWVNTHAAASPERHALVRMMLRKNLECGLQAKTINSVIPNAIFRVPYQRCSGESKLDKVSYRAIAQLKANGMFSYFIPGGHPRNDQPFITRNGSGYNLFGCVSDILNVVSGGRVVVGEMVVKDEDGGWLERQASNGIMDKFIDDTGTPTEANRVVFRVWDILPVSTVFSGKPCKEPYETRFSRLVDLNIDQYDGVELIESAYVNNIEEARAFYRRMRDRGEEGAILKDPKATWADNTSPLMIKLKNVSEAEFRIVDAYPGEKGGKWEKYLGGLTVTTECGGILTDVGMGFSNAQRREGVDWWKDQIGKIVTVKFTEVIDDKTDRATKCLDGARLVEPRFNEKTVADTLEHCLEISK